MPADYDIWLEKVKAAIDGKNKRAVARWIAERLDRSVDTSEVTLHRMLAGREPRAPFMACLNTWMELGGPVIEATNVGKAGGEARAEKLSPKRRSAIAKKARAARG